MFAVLTHPRKAVRRAVSAGRSRAVGLLALLGVAACAPTGMGNGPAPGPGGRVQVALLVPSGSGQGTDELIARSLEQSARLAMADLKGATVDLRVYPTAGQASTAAAAATRAVAEGAMVILGPVYAEEANAAGVAAAASGVSVLSFSNNTAIAGGNVFVLGPTFQNSAARVARYAAQQGKRSIFVVHGNSTAETTGRDAVTQAISASGASLAGSAAFDLSQQGVIDALPGIAAQVKASGANAVFLTSSTDGALPLLTQLMTENGLPTATTQYLGLTRWDIPPAAQALPGLQGGWFALPDPGLNAQFQSRYAAAYGEAPHGIGSLAYDGIAAIGALASGGTGPLSAAALTQGSGFAGVNGVFRLRADGTNERGLAVATLVNNQVVILDPAPRSFGGAGF